MTRDPPRNLSAAQAKPATAPVETLAAAREAHRAGRLAEAEALYRQAIAAAPASAAEAHYRLGVLYAQAGRGEPAVEQFAAAARLAPGSAAIAAGLGNALLAASRPAEAIAAYRRALGLRPEFAEAHFNLANALRLEGDRAGAAESYGRAIALAPAALPAHINLAVTLQEMGEHARAEAALRKALALEPRSREALYNLGIVLAAQGRTEEAIAAYRSLIALDPDTPEAAGVHVNLGQLLEARQASDEAIACFRRAIALDPSLSPAYNNLAAVLAAGGRLDEAIEVARKALALEPEAPWLNVNLAMLLNRKFEGAHRGAALLDEAIECCGRALAREPSLPEAHRLLAEALIGRGRTEEAFRSFMRHARLVHGSPPGGGDRAPAQPYKLKHDREQLAYLLENELVALPQPHGEGAASSRDHRPPPDPLAAIFHIEGGQRLAGPAINPGNDTAAIEAAWAASRPNIAVVDDLLTPEGLGALRRFCWGSTIWREPYRNGYLGAFPLNGFACPLLVQVAEELRGKYPGIIKDHVLTTAWAFKYDSRLEGINVHADFAAVNVNFWITPDEANLDPDSGGLVIWDKPAPLDWDFAQYNQDEAAIYGFLERAGARSVTVPYRANRAVVFDSDLFHKTDSIRFKDGYTSRRINITFLYGYRHQSR